MPKKSFLVACESGQYLRLDVFLSGKIQDLSRSQIQKQIEEGRVRVNGKACKSSFRLSAGEYVEIYYELGLPQKLKPEDIPIRVLYRDDHLVVIDKPSGLVIHPGAGNKGHTLANALIYHFPEIKKIGPEDRPGIVHRLDKETSGIMVVALTEEAYCNLRSQFKHREIKKTYLGLVLGKMSQEKGKISWPIGRHVKHGERISVKTRKPRSAETLYQVLKTFKDFSFLEVKPVTGRTHQIRVHFAASGHPIAGDTRYGRRRTKKKGLTMPRLFLHAHLLEFTHPATKERVVFQSPLADDLKEYLKKLAY